MRLLCDIRRPIPVPKFCLKPYVPILLKHIMSCFHPIAGYFAFVIHRAACCTPIDLATSHIMIHHAYEIDVNWCALFMHMRMQSMHAINQSLLAPADLADGANNASPMSCSQLLGDIFKVFTVVGPPFGCPWSPLPKFLACSPWRDLPNCR